MPFRLDITDPDFDTAFSELLNAKRETSSEVGATVHEILSQVRKHGDKAVYDYTKQFDHLDLSQVSMTITGEEIEEALKQVDQATFDALKFAAERIASHHQTQKPEDHYYTDSLGVKLGSRWTPVDSVGLYVPGGTASYPSSVLMNAIPAIVAGVKRIAMVVPSPNNVLNPLVLAAAKLSGVTEIYRIGGAQAIAALAYGTETIEPVCKIVGPGNAWVAAAKKEVFGTVGIDMIAGPSEVLIIADGENNPDWIATDLMAQAEHDVSAQSILITDDFAFAEQVVKSVENVLETLPRADIAAQSWRDFGAIIKVDNLDEAPALANQLAAEHLELAVDNPEELAAKIPNAGAIFLGRYTPEAIGDYVAGTNHVLPTARSARFSSGLGVLDYMKRTSMLQCDLDALRELAPSAVTLGAAESLDAHALSVSKRLKLDS